MSETDGGSAADAEGSSDVGDPPPTRRDGGGIYVDGGSGDDGGGIVRDLCPPEMEVAFGCLTETDEGAADLCNGLDDDCDGQVDEGCVCVPGAVQRCFAGPPERRGVGACTDGMQRCIGMGEFGAWGPCEGGGAPRPEACDDLDNDCNGCIDEIEGCVPSGSCPGPGDPRVPDGRPFSTYPLRGADFYPGADAVSWRWTVRGTPCDRMFESIPGSPATQDNGQLSYRVENADRRDAAIQFTLSGDYEVTLSVTRADGSTFECTWVVHVRAPGLRVELCWDQTGPTASDTVDVDLHLGKHGVTPAWFDEQDCDYRSCDTNRRSGGLDWGYPETDIANCTGPGARGSFSGGCPNPRLDIDNISRRAEYVPENINLDNPQDGDRFRIMVHHYTSATRSTYPLVNVYCGGELRASYGVAPDRVEGFDEGGGRNGGDMWRVADVTMRVAADGTTTGCDIVPLRPPGMASGYYVTTDDSRF